MKNINLCAVVMDKSIEDIIQKLTTMRDKTKFVEIRFDLSINRKKNDIQLLSNVQKKHVIFTCRRKDEGGQFGGSEKERIQILKRAFDLGFLVDVELTTLEENKMRLSRSMQKRAILSFHDFMKTPSKTDLDSIVKRMAIFNPHIKKIATMVKNEDDNKRLLNVVIQKNTKENICVIGMGPLGKKTRIIAPLLGSCMTYCSINSDGASAPGQMTCNDMNTIYSLLQ